MGRIVHEQNHFWKIRELMDNKRTHLTNVETTENMVGSLRSTPLDPPYPPGNYRADEEQGWKQ